MKKILVVITLLGHLPASFAKDSEISITQANIYLLKPYEELPINEVEQLDNKTDIKVIIHGYLAHRGHPSIVPIKNAYLAQGTDNVFMADWERAASYDYPTSRNLVHKVALHFGEIISTFIIKHEIDPNKVHLIGHSLGAHIAGDIGRYFNGTLGRVTGLDPALPLFTPQSPDGLGSSNGKFIDVIHTDYPVFGDLTPRGHADFYPNLGRVPQPGCSDSDLRTFTSCSHFRAVLLYAESIGMPRNFPAIPCSLANIRFDAELGLISSIPTHESVFTESLEHGHEPCVWCLAGRTLLSSRISRCKSAATLNSTVMMGEYLDKRARGQYYLETNAAPPYGFGDSSDIYRKS